jgi:two-component system response regulator NreC
MGMGERLERPLRILIVEDHTLFRVGLRALLTMDAGIEIVGEEDNGRDAIRAVGDLKPDVVMMDLTMPGMNGMEAIGEIKRRYPETRVLVVTLHKTEEFVFASLRAGADGYILKDATHEELRLALRSVSMGKTYLSRDVSVKVANGYRESGDASRPPSAWDSLTHREREVLKLVAEGRSNKEVAEFLFLSVKTVEKHRASLMLKLGVHKTAGLTAYAIEKGLVVS